MVSQPASSASTTTRPNQTHNTAAQLSVRLVWQVRHAGWRADKTAELSDVDELSRQDILLGWEFHCPFITLESPSGQAQQGDILFEHLFDNWRVVR